MPTIYILLKSYWKPLTLALLIVLTIIFIYFYGNTQYNKGVEYTSSKMQENFNIIIAERDAQARQASKNYQALKSEREVKQGIQYVEIEKIVRSPVYLTECIDDAGLSQINSAIRGE